MTLSCADLRWPELFQIIARTNGKNITTEEVEALSYDEKCRLLNLNPVIVAKHFQYRVETFFTILLHPRYTCSSVDASLSKELLPVLRKAKKENAQAAFNVDKLIINGEIYRGPETKSLPFYVRILNA